MQWKPIANKYRKGMMKSTLQARVLRLFIFLLLKLFVIFLILKLALWHTRSKGSERESEIA
jgi:hypothetical protein